MLQDVPIQLSNQYEKTLLVSGQAIYGFKNDLITDQIKQKGYFDKHIYDFLVTFVKTNKQSIVLDIGANIGSYTLPMAQYAKKVMAFEPIKEVFSVLEHNISINQLNNVKLLQVGLSNAAEKVLIYRDQSGNVGGSSINKSLLSDSAASEEITLVLGDDVVRQEGIEKIDLIKIDIEGYEHFALLGLEKSILTFKPVIVCEWNCDQTRQGFATYSLFERLFPGYVVRGLGYDFLPNLAIEKIYRFLKKHVLLNYTLRPIARPFYKLFPRKFCAYLSVFNPADSYSAVLLVPKEREYKLRRQQWLDFLA